MVFAIQWHESAMGVHVFPHPESPSHLPPHPIPQGHLSAPALSTLSHALNLDWWSVSHMVIYMFQCYSLKSSHPHLLPQSPKVCSSYLCLFCCLTYMVIITIFLNSTYKWDCIVLVFLFLTYFTQYDNLQVCPCCCKWLYFILFIVPYCFANKSPSSQGYGFSSNHVWMWELDHKESWAPKNWCFQIVVLQKTLESNLESKKTKVNAREINPKYSLEGPMLEAEAPAPILWPPDVKSWLIRKDPDAVKDWGQEEKRETKDEMVGWHHRLNGHEFEQTLGDRGQGSLVCCSSWDCKESDMT